MSVDTQLAITSLILMQPRQTRMLPLALRQHYLTHGYAVVKGRDVFGSMVKTEDPAALSTNVELLVTSSRRTVLAAAHGRPEEFVALPSIESVIKGETRLRDPAYEKLMSRYREYQANRRRRSALLKRYRTIKRQRRQQLAGTAQPSMSGADIWKLTKAVYDELQSERSPQLSRSTVDNDPQLQRAITAHRVNLWMTNREAENLVRGAFGKAIGSVMQQVAGVERPVLFCDRPIWRPMYGRPHHFGCAAPGMGIGPSHSCGGATAFLVMHRLSPTSMYPHVIRQSHQVVRAELARRSKGQAIELLESMSPAFKPMESHMRFVTRLFDWTAPDAQGAVSVPLLDVDAGDVIIADPFLLVGFGPNVTPREEVLWQWNVVDSTHKVSMEPPSWIREWRSSADRVDFRANTVFPSLL